MVEMLVDIERFISDARARALEVLKFSKDEEERGLELHRKSIVIDTLFGGPKPFSDRMVRRAKEMVDEGKPLEAIRTEMAKMGAVDEVEDPKTREDYLELWRRSGVTCTSSTVASNSSLMDAVRSISSIRYRNDKLRDFEVLATSAQDIKGAKKEGKHAYLLNFQNTVPIGGGANVDAELDNVDLFYGLGLRVIQLTYNLRNFVGDGCTERHDSGLSCFGLRVVERMNKLGMVVDVSHCGHGTTMDAVEVSKAPVAATHSGCKALSPHHRCKTDEELKAIAERGGYIGIFHVPTFLGGRGTIKEFLDHVDHVVDLVGASHVGVGTDNSFPGGAEPEFLWEYRRREGTYPFPFKKPPSGGFWWNGFRDDDPRARLAYSPEMREDEERSGSLAWVNWPYFTVGLATRGYSDQEIQGIVGGNFLSLLEKVIG